jgi:hypothetical protein
MNRCPQCGKSSYPTATAAWRVIQLRTHQRTQQRHRDRMPPGGLAYRCDHCYPWHITSQQKSDGPRFRLARMEREWRA